MKTYLTLGLLFLCSFSCAESGRVKEVSGLTLIDGNARVTGVMQVDRYQEYLAVSTPTTPATGRARTFLNGNRICTKFADASVTCYSSSTGIGTITEIDPGIGIVGGGLTGAVTISLSTPIVNSYIDGSSVTKQGNLITFSQLSVSTASLQTQVLAVGLTTATLRTQILAVGLTTATLQSNISAVGVSTGNIQTTLNSVAVSTATLFSYFPVSISTNTNLTVSGQIILSGNNLSVGKVSLSTGVFGPITTSSLTVTGSSYTLNGFVYPKAPSIQKFTSGSGTYTTPTSPIPLYLFVVVVGGGGGGSGSGTTAGIASSAGGGSSFGTSLLTANGGSGGVSGLAGGAGGGPGGTGTIASPAYGTVTSGGSGGGGNNSASTTLNQGGSMGASSCLGGAGGGGQQQVEGSTATVNSGSGGGGGGVTAVASSVNGTGGGAGACIQAFVPANLSTTYSYTVGAAGAPGGAGTSGKGGGGGGSGYVEVREFYQ